MIPVYLRLTNFMSHVNSEIKFDELDSVTLIMGMREDNDKLSNGSGKSSLFDAITWALYEKSRADGSASTGIDSVVRGQTDKCEVEFQFLLGDDLYRVVRCRDKKRKKSDLLFQVKSGSKWHSVAADSKRETNASVVHTIGIDYEVFINSVLLGQHKVSAFADMTSGERKEVVAKILQLSYYDEYVVQAKKRLEELNNRALEYDAFLQINSATEKNKQAAEQEMALIKEKIEAYQKRIEALKSVIDRLRQEQSEEGKKITVIKELLGQRKKIEIRIKESATSLRDIGESLKRSEVEVERLKQVITQKQERILQIKQERGDPSILKRELQECENKVKGLVDKQTTIAIQVGTLTRQIKELHDESKRVTNLEEGACPTCYQSVTPNGKQEVLRVLEAKINVLEDRLSKGRDFTKSIDSAMEEANRHLAEVQAKKRAFNELQEEGRSLMSTLEIEKKGFLRETEQLESNRVLKKSMVESLAVVQEELAKCIERIEALGEVDETRFQKLTQQVMDKNSELETTQRTMGELQRKIGGLQERIEVYQQTIDKIEQTKQQRALLDHERRIEKELINAFGKTGIQALILENSAIEIEKIANDLLSKLTNDGVRIAIQTQKPNQDGTLKEVFDIIITDAYHSSPFSMYSGGEKFRVAFVVRMALSILLSRRVGVRVGAIFYDEAFQDLDEDGIDRIIEVFKLLSQDFRYQLVITHTSQLKDYFKDVIVVNKTSEGSFVVKK